QRGRGMIRLLLFLTLFLLCDEVLTKRNARLTEVRVVNECPLNIKLRCQSVLTDGKDRFVGPGQASQLVFHDFLLGNRHFWCDVYALNQFDETFDIYGGGRGEKGNLTWLIRPDGLYDEREEKVLNFDTWQHTPEIYLPWPSKLI
ncbi:hypothetical protein PMAYCL1PPCAC_07317, partial [Pristionchus mayeri]